MAGVERRTRTNAMILLFYASLVAASYFASRIVGSPDESTVASVSLPVVAVILALGDVA